MIAMDRKVIAEKVFRENGLDMLLDDRKGYGAIASWTNCRLGGEPDRGDWYIFEHVGSASPE